MPAIAISASRPGPVASLAATKSASVPVNVSDAPATRMSGSAGVRVATDRAYGGKAGSAVGYISANVVRPSAETKWRSSVDG
jgi:hypothetical protein